MTRRSPAKAGVQEAMPSIVTDNLAPSGAPGPRPAPGNGKMKPINPWPLIAMLILVVFLYLWLNGYLA